MEHQLRDTGIARMKGDQNSYCIKKGLFPHEGNLAVRALHTPAGNTECLFDFLSAFRTYAGRRWVSPPLSAHTSTGSIRHLHVPHELVIYVCIK